jgi:hypothetical protein
MGAATAKIRSIITIFGMGLAIYWSFTYSGPFRYLAEWQLKTFGWYSGKLTVMVIALVFFGVGEALRVILRGSERPVLGAAAASVAPNTARKLSSPSSAYRRLALLIIPFAFGAYFYASAASAGDLRELEIADLTSGDLPSHTLFAEVHGYVDRFYVRQNHYMYLPLREAKGATTPIQVVVGMDQSEGMNLPRQADGSLTMRGMLQTHLDNAVRFTFQKNGVVLADSCRVLYTGRTPASDQKVGMFLIAGTFLVGVAWAGMISRKNQMAGVPAAPTRART